MTDPRIRCGDAGATPGEIDLADYTRSIERLNTSLGFLQTEMQRLAQQQEKIMAMREQQQQAWVIPPPAPSPHRYHFMIDVNNFTGKKESAKTYRTLSVFFPTGSSVSCAAAV